MFKKIMAMIVAFSIVASFSVTSFAADLMLDGSFYRKQEWARSCTLASAAMLLTRRAYLNGDEDWSSITESAIRSTAWSNGLLWQFTYRGMTVNYGSLSSRGNTDELIALLEEHPEGIVAYDRSHPHAILLTDYTDGVFYCADPAPGASYGRMPVSYAIISLANVTNYWYVAYDANEQLDTAEVDELTILGMFYPENLRAGSSFNLGGILKAPEADPLTEITVKIIDAEGTVMQEASDVLEESTTEWSFRNLNADILFGSLTAGEYAFSFVAKDSDGTTVCFAQPFTVSNDATVTGYYWTANAETAA